MKPTETRPTKANESPQQVQNNNIQSFLSVLSIRLNKSTRGCLPCVLLLALMAISSETTSLFQYVNLVKLEPVANDSDSTGLSSTDQSNSTTEQSVNQGNPATPETRHSSLGKITNYLQYVVTLQGVEGADDSNVGRYDSFKRHWNILCHHQDNENNDDTQQHQPHHHQQQQQQQQQTQEQFHFHTCPGHLSPRGTAKGYGLSKAYLQCFHWALKNHKKWHKEHNPNDAEGLDDDSIPFVFLEDDARLYNSNFCYSEYRNRIWQSLPQTNATLLMLGGHGIAFNNVSHPVAKSYQDHYYNETLLMDPSVLPQFVVRPQRGFGSYGFVLLNTGTVEYFARKTDQMLNRTFNGKGMKGFKAIDQQFHHYGLLKTVMSYPWLVYHEGGVYSNTKGAVRGEFGDGSKQYRWVKGLTGSAKNCSSSGRRSSSDAVRFYTARYDKGNHMDLDTSTGHQKGTVLISCRQVAFRIHSSSFSSRRSKSSTSNSSVMILVAVVSQRNHSDRRASIRSTWGKDSATIFFIVSDPWKEIASEFQEHHDLVWVDLPEESERNNSNSDATNMVPSLQVATFLMIADVQYGGHYSHILKVTDHSYANLSAIRSYLLDNNEDRQKIAMHGTHCSTGVRPSHVGVPETEYSDYFFPQYCKGDGYAMSKIFVQCAVTQIPQSRIVSLDDAYIGILGERCGLQADQFRSGAYVEKGKMPLLQHNIETGAAMEEYHSKQLNANLDSDR